MLDNSAELFYQPVTCLTTKWTLPTVNSIHQIINYNQIIFKGLKGVLDNLSEELIYQPVTCLTTKEILPTVNSIHQNIIYYQFVFKGLLGVLDNSSAD